jgi:hypothetical protein
MRLSEKTFELNLCVQMTPIVNAPSWWFGLTQKQESAAGWDVATKVSGTWLRFQLKASNNVLSDGRRRFKGHHQQLVELQSRATNPRRVFYVLPTIGSTADLIAANFALIPNVRFLDVNAIPNIGYPTTPAGALRKNETHYFDLAEDLTLVTIHSEPVEVPVLTAAALANALRRPSHDDVDNANATDAVADVRDFLRRGRNRFALFLPR